MAPSFVPVGVAATTPHQAKVFALSSCVCRVADMLKELVYIIYSNLVSNSYSFQVHSEK